MGTGETQFFHALSVGLASLWGMDLMWGLVMTDNWYLLGIVLSFLMGEWMLYIDNHLINKSK